MLGDVLDYEFIINELSDNAKKIFFWFFIIFFTFFC